MMDMLGGSITSDWYSYLRGEIDVAPGVTLRCSAKASQATINAISCTKALVSRALVPALRSNDILARTQGCVDTWMLLAADMLAGATGKAVQKTMCHMHQARSINQNDYQASYPLLQLQADGKDKQQ